MSYYQEYSKFKEFDFGSFFAQITDDDIRGVLAKDRLEREDFLVLLSPKASNYLEEMAQKAHKLTVQNFGRIIFLYAPLYWPITVLINVLIVVLMLRMGLKEIS